MINIKFRHYTYFLFIFFLLDFNRNANNPFTVPAVIEGTLESEVEDQRQTPLNADRHAANPCSEQPENVVHMNVPFPSESVRTSTLHETNELRRPDRLKSKFGESTKVQADEKSSDIWTPPNQRQISGVSSTDENLADENITKVQQPTEEGSESGSSVDPKPNQENQADAKVIFLTKKMLMMKLYIIRL